MTIAPNKSGSVITFYSYKGGVGRTMALANVAFIAAHNGYKVLVMDWDLEAPGLSYYFRGLTNPEVARQISDAPGILNILTSWTREVSAARGKDDIDSVLRAYSEGAPFADCVRPLVANTYLQPSGALDYISPGSRLLQKEPADTYEEALARFSWPAFFSEYGGGLLIEQLIAWSKQHYDLVFVDSRTGLADAAGLCTIQIPDTVALCFVLNKQNIDGVARIGAAIRDHRGSDVRLRAVPMRVARHDTSEESDARARAIAELTRKSRFDKDQVISDLKQLEIPAADNVPFYETLSFVAPSSASADVLAISYLRLANEITGLQLAAPQLTEQQLEDVRAKLQPRHATVDFVFKLRSSEPARLVSELGRLIASAHDSLLDHWVPDDDYLQALVETAFTLDGGVSLEEEQNIHNGALRLTRALFDEDRERWLALRVDSLSKHLDIFGSIIPRDEEILLLLELDSLLAPSNTSDSLLRRIAANRQLAWLYFNQADYRRAESAGSRIGELIESCTAGGAAADRWSPDLHNAHIETQLLRAEIARAVKDFDQAVGVLHAILKEVEAEPPGTVSLFTKTIRARALCALVSLPEGVLTTRAKAEYAVAAMEAGAGQYFVIGIFDTIVKVLATTEAGDLGLRVLCSLFPADGDRQARTFIMYFARSASSAIRLLDGAAALIRAIPRPIGQDEVLKLESVAMGVDQILKSSARLIRPPRQRSDHQKLVVATLELQAALADAGLSWTPTFGGPDQGSSLR